jgi:hypothetical protein
MRHHIIIDRTDTDGRLLDPEVYPCDTRAEMDSASAALREAPVWTGEPGEAVKTSLVLSADTSEPDDGLEASDYGDRWHVVDPDGGRWWPSDATLAEIEASDDPAATALEICRRSPMRGRWAQ